MQISSRNNSISFAGEYSLENMPPLLAALHSAIEKRGYKDVIIDFEDCTLAFAGPMLGLISHVQAYLNNGIDITLKLPKEKKLERLFRNANWASLIDFRSFDPSNFAGSSQVPAIKFRNATEQHEAVQNILKILFGALQGFSRSDLSAIEWSLNEITDNVMNHAQSSVGGFIQITNFSKAAKRVEFVVADPGIGIPGSLRPTHNDIKTDHEALDRAIREGVTRSADAGQGNGLFGTWRISQLSGGKLNIFSNYGRLSSDPKNGLHIGAQSIPFNGTLVVASIPYDNPVDLAEAFNFTGKKHHPIDYIELHFNADAHGRAILMLKEESTGFGSREAGRQTRNKILNLLRCSGSAIAIDFIDVHLISSSYADEAFASLFLALGPLEFSSRIHFQNIDPLVKSLIDRAIIQRTRQ